MSAGEDKTLLLVEDDRPLRERLARAMEARGFTVSIAETGLKGLEKARNERPEVIILDLMLPEMTGEKVCKALKEDASTAGIPIIMLTAKSQPEERIQGLELGADDYVPKPFSPKELVLRVQALLRRVRKSEQGNQVEVDEFLIDKAAFEVRLGGDRLDLTTTEFKLLTLLIDRRGRTQSRDALLYDVWGYRNAIDTRTVDTHMRRLREKLGDHAARLETVRGEGYRFSALSKP